MQTATRPAKPHRPSGPRHQWNGLEPHRSSLVGFLSRRRRCRFEIDDIVQETFLRAARFRRDEVPDELLRPWLFSIARNVFRDQLRRDSRYEYSSDHEGLAAASGRRESHLRSQEPEPRVCFMLDGHVLDPLELARELPIALAQLPARDRRLLEHFYGDDGSSCRRTGLALGLAADLVKVRLYRARRKLERIMRRTLLLDLSPRLREAV